MDETPVTLPELLRRGIATMHRDPYGVWCVPTRTDRAGQKFVLDDAKTYECVTCRRVWHLA